MNHWKKIEVAGCGKLSLSNLFNISLFLGNKLLSTVLKQGNVYLVTKSAAYNWDLCAAHAILRSINGQILDLQQIINFYEQNQTTNNFDFTKYEILYNNIKSDNPQPKDYACQPFIAFYNASDLTDILQLFVVNKILIE